MVQINRRLVAAGVAGKWWKIGGVITQTELKVSCSMSTLLITNTRSSVPLHSVDISDVIMDELPGIEEDDDGPIEISPNPPLKFSAPKGFVRGASISGAAKRTALTEFLVPGFSELYTGAPSWTHVLQSGFHLQSLFTTKRSSHGRMQLGTRGSMSTQSDCLPTHSLTTPKVMITYGPRS